MADQIVAELGAGKVQEAFRHLKGWYRAAAEMQTARPQTMEQQTEERVALYAKRVAYGESFPENGTPFEIWDDEPTEGELRTAVMELSNGRYAGASGIKAEHLKSWLRGAKREEDPETAGANAGAGETWR